MLNLLVKQASERSADSAEGPFYISQFPDSSKIALAQEAGEAAGF
jgi:hypothetical protein